MIGGSQGQNALVVGAQRAPSHPRRSGAMSDLY